MRKARGATRAPQDSNEIFRGEKAGLGNSAVDPQPFQHSRGCLSSLPWQEV